MVDFQELPQVLPGFLEWTKMTILQSFQDFKNHSLHALSRDFPMNILPLNPHLVIPDKSSISFTLFHLTDKMLELFLTLQNWGIERGMEEEKILYRIQAFMCPSDVVTARYFSLNN